MSRLLVLLKLVEQPIRCVLSLVRIRFRMLRSSGVSVASFRRLMTILEVDRQRGGSNIPMEVGILVARVYGLVVPLK